MIGIALSAFVFVSGATPFDVGSLPPKPPLVGGVLGARAAVHPEGEVLFAEPGDGSLWARGATYKASFDRSGATFIPWLGPRAAEDHPLAFSIASLISGGTSVPFSPSVAPTRSERAVTFDRASFVERYEIAPDSLEQTFVFASLPGRGDLVLSLEARSDLAPSASAASEGGLRFEHELGGLDYARAVAVDASGRRELLASAISGTRIEIRVPASFLETAALPLTIDPVISTFGIDTTGFNDFAPDVAYDAATDRYMVCYEEAYSATDHDVYEDLLDSTGARITGTYIDVTTNDWRHPRIANSRPASQFMVAAQVGAPGGRSIWSCVADAATNTLGAQTQVAPAWSGVDQVDPDIGGDGSTVSGSTYLVAWEFFDSSSGNRSIVQMLMHPSGLPDSNVAICIDCAAGAHNFNPSVSKVGGAGPGLDHLRTVVYEYEYSTSDHDLYAAQLYDAYQNLGPYTVDGSAIDDRNPNVSSFADRSSSPGNYLVTSQRLLGSDTDIAGWILNGSTQIAAQNLSGAEGPAYFYQNQVGASADSDGLTFAVGYSELYSASTTDYDVYIAEFDPDGNQIDCIEPHQNLAYTSIPEIDVQVTAAHHGPAMRYFAAWTQAAAGNGDVWGGLYGAPAVVSYCYPGLDGVQACPCANPPTGGGGCNNSINTGGASLTASGTSSLSADSFFLSQSGERPTSFSIVLQGTQDAPAGILWGDGVRCVRGSLKRLYSHPAVGGSVSAPVGADLPVHARSAALGDVIGAGESRFYQIYYRDPNLAFCPAGYNVGNAIKAVWIP